MVAYRPAARIRDENALGCVRVNRLEWQPKKAQNNRGTLKGNGGMEAGGVEPPGADLRRVDPRPLTPPFDLFEHISADLKNLRFFGA